MNRPIKFRVWDTKREVVADVAIIHFDAKEGYVIVTDEYVWNEDPETGEAECQIMLSDCELMQYTGLKDKNGKEIYEGDILKLYFEEDKLEDWFWLSLKDEERERGYVYLEVKYPEIFAQALPDDFEVIGNIYENPELLNQLSEKGGKDE